MIPVILNIGPIPINSFGLLMVLAIVATWQRLTLELKLRNLDPELAEKIVFWGALGGFLGARLLFIASNVRAVLHDPISGIFGGAGFIYWGGFVGGAVAIVFLLRKNDLPIRAIADACALPLGIGYAVGRLGCQLSGDGDYGSESSLPWAMSYELGVYPSPEGLLMHPSPIYETLLALLGCYLILHLRRKDFLNGEGKEFAFYLLVASLSRFGIEYLRIEPVISLGLTQAQLISIATSVIAACYLLVPKRKLEKT